MSGEGETPGGGAPPVRMGRRACREVACRARRESKGGLGPGRKTMLLGLRMAAGRAFDRFTSMPAFRARHEMLQRPALDESSSQQQAASALYCQAVWRFGLGAGTHPLAAGTLEPTTGV